MRFLLPFLFFPIFALIPTFAQDEGGGGEVPPLTEKQKTRLGALLPPPGGELAADPDEERTFFGDDLFTLINGAAPAYLDFGFTILAHVPYKAGDTSVVLDVFDMGTPLQAFGMYAAERDGDDTALSMGAAGVVGKTYLRFVQGRYYVKIESSGDDEAKMKRLMHRVATEVSQRIGKDKSLPAELKLLPDGRRLPWSRMYDPKAPLAMESLAPAIRAIYRQGAKKDDKKTTLWISLAGSEKESKARAEGLRARLPADTVKDLPELGAGAFTGKDKYTGDLVVVPQGQRLLVLTDPPADPGPLVRACAMAAEKKGK